MKLPVVLLGLGLFGIIAGYLPAQAADPAPKSASADDDDDDLPPVKSASTGAPGKPPSMAQVLFEPLAVRNWSAELGIRQRFTSRQGRRNSVEGATGLTYDVSWQDTLFLSSDRGLGVNVFSKKGIFAESDRFFAGVSINIDDDGASERSRSQSRSVDLKRGVTTFALGFAEYKIDRWRMWSEVAHFLGPDKGNVLSLGLEYRLPLTNKWSTTFGSGISFGDGAYMRQNFSVPLSVPLALGRPLIQPKAGARDFTVSADFEYQADEHWRWNTVVGFTQSLAVSQQGAFINVQSQPFISTGIKYKF
jgi:outer membrane scaffolding protein for murein synthesis (MipA/OmpV family)